MGRCGQLLRCRRQRPQLPREHVLRLLQPRQAHRSPRHSGTYPTQEHRHPRSVRSHHGSRKHRRPSGHLWQSHLQRAHLPRHRTAGQERLCRARCPPHSCPHLRRPLCLALAHPRCRYLGRLHAGLLHPRQPTPRARLLQPALLHHSAIHQSHLQQHLRRKYLQIFRIRKIRQRHLREWRPRDNRLLPRARSRRFRGAHRRR